MRSREWRLRIEDILETIAKIKRYTAHMTPEDFGNSDLTVDAVIRNLEILGEASRHVPAEIETRYSQIPWGKMRSIRNVVIHEYFGVSTSIVWQTIAEDLPPLVPLLQQILEEAQDVSPADYSEAE